MNGVGPIFSLAHFPVYKRDVFHELEMPYYSKLFMEEKLFDHFPGAKKYYPDAPDEDKPNVYVYSWCVIEQGEYRMFDTRPRDMYGIVSYQAYSYPLKDGSRKVVFIDANQGSPDQEPGPHILGAFTRDEALDKLREWSKDHVSSGYTAVEFSDHELFDFDQVVPQPNSLGLTL